MSCDATPPAAPMPTHPAPDPIGRRAAPQPASRMLRGIALATLAVGAVGGCELRRVPDGAWRLRQLATRSAATQAPLAGVPPRVYALDAEALSRAYYFSDDEEYAGRARLLLRTWFLDPATRMNPHLRYGQGIPGVTQGRAAGIIETRGLVGVVDAIGMLERSPSWTAADQRGMAQWLSAYLGWLRSSAI